MPLWLAFLKSWERRVCGGALGDHGETVWGMTVGFGNEHSMLQVGVWKLVMEEDKWKGATSCSGARSLFCALLHQDTSKPISDTGTCMSTSGRLL